MQPSPLPRTLLFAGLLTLAAVTAAPSASALAWMRATYFYDGGLIGVWYDFDPESGQAAATLCIFTHDSYRPPHDLPASAGEDGDGDYAVWVIAGTDPSSGSNKASTACFSAPPDAPGGPDLPGTVQGFL